MKHFIVYIFWLAFSSIVVADAPRLWADGKITPEQPFPCKVIGVVPSWGGAIIILQEDGEKSRYCVANLIMGAFTYQIVESNNFDKKEWIEKNATFIEPSAEIEHFSWSLGIHRIGRTFGEEDFVGSWYAESRKREQLPLPNHSIDDQNE